MRKLALAALVVALATPAWAWNEVYPGMHPSTQAEWEAAYDICHRVETNAPICAMKNAHTETVALSVATSVLNRCDKQPEGDCSAARAYIKQRWGY